MIAAGLNLWPNLRVSLRSEPQTLVGTVTRRPQAWPLAVVGLSGILLAIIFVYLVLENLHHVPG